LFISCSFLNDNKNYKNDNNKKNSDKNSDKNYKNNNNDDTIIIITITIREKMYKKHRKNSI